MSNWQQRAREPYDEIVLVRRPSARVLSGKRPKDFVQTRRDTWSRLGLPPFSDVQRLLEIYAASGEGLGAFIAAQEQVERTYGPAVAGLGTEYIFHPRPPDEGFDEDGRHSRPRPRPPGPRPSRPSAISSDESSDARSPPGPSAEAEERREYEASRKERDEIRRAQERKDQERHRESRRATERRSRRTTEHVRPDYQPYVEDYVDYEDDELVYAELPAVENEFRLRTRTEGSRRHSRRTQPEEVQLTRERLRGGASNGDDFGSRECKGRSARLRGGAYDTGDSVPPTKTSPLGAGTLPGPNDPDLISEEPRRIILLFFYISEGKIELSPKPEVYTTFQETLDPAFAIRDQISDRWLVIKLKEQYKIVTRRSRGLLRRIFLMRTIGFAHFLRFERTTRRKRDKGGFFMSAKVPAITANTEPTSQFRYLLRYPLEFKQMLVLLDRLAATSAWGRKTFYAVEIREAPDTTKIYVLLALLIIVSTGGGATYAVLQEDISTGVSIATYALTCLTLFLALVAAGQWLGLTQPSAFSYAYSVEDNLFWGFNNVDDAITKSSTLLRSRGR